MQKRRLFTWIGLITLAVGLTIGFLEILDRRFAEGGVYAHYASFRSDPLGASVLYETLLSLPGTSVSRNQTHLNRIDTLDGDTTLLLLGYPRDGLGDLRVPEDSPVMKAVEEGARLVITFNPGLVPEKFQPARSDEEKDWFERRRELQKKRDAEKAKDARAPVKEKKAEKGEPSEEAESDSEAEANADGSGETGSGEGLAAADEKEKGKADSDADPDSEDEEEKDFEARMSESIGPRITDKLGFELESLEEFERPEEGWELNPGKGSEKVPRALPAWYSQFRFESLADEWKTVAESEGKAVVIERPWGEGSIVLASDTYFVSNEALYREAYPEFLLWILGGKSRVVFDETIHGVQETGGAMKLMRRYRVHGIFFGLLVVVILWAWRSASSLAPGSEDLDRGLVGRGSQVSGEETEAGLTRLLRRSIPPSQLFEKCLGVWSESTRSTTPEVEKKKAEILARHLSDPKDYNTVEAYRDMIDLLRRR